MSERAVRAVLAAVAFGVRLMDAGSGLVVAQVVPALGVARRSVQERTAGRQDSP